MREPIVIQKLVHYSGWASATGRFRLLPRPQGRDDELLDEAAAGARTSWRSAYSPHAGSAQLEQVPNSPNRCCAVDPPRPWVPIT